MIKLGKCLQVLMNLINYAAGIAVAIILIFKQDFYSFVFAQKLTTTENLFLNLIVFQVVITLISVLTNSTSITKKSTNQITLPIIYIIIPAIIGVVGIYFGIVGNGAFEKIFVIIASITYVVLSYIIVYSGAKIFQLNSSDKKEKVNKS